MIKDRKNILLRGYLVGVILFLLSVAIVYSMIKIRVQEGEELAEFAQQNHRLTTEPSERGNLYASEGNLLATTVTKHDIYVDLITIKSELFESEVFALSDSLAKMFDKSSSYFEKKLRAERRKKNRYMLLVKGLDYNEYNRIKSFPIFNKGQNKGGFIHETRLQRELVLQGVGGRTIGYDDNRGKAGLEGAYAHYLEGVEGIRWEQFMGGGKWKPFRVWEQEPSRGLDVFTTIDADIQIVAYEALNQQLAEYEAQHGCVIVMEVNTGKVRAMVNLKRMNDGSYADVYNYAVGERAEPGSTFKTISILAGLEQNKFKPETTVETGNGRYRLYNRIISDTHGYGTLTVGETLEKSSNIGTAKLIDAAYKENPKEFINLLEKWKLTKKLNIDIPGEAEPEFLSPEDKSWSKTTLPVMSYGYGFTQTPLQILTFYNGIANKGKMLKPLFVEKTENNGEFHKEFKPEVLINKIASEENIEAITTMLTDAVEEGTGRNVKNEHYKVAGKTGTARVEYWVKNQKMQYRASFAGFFPADNPKYSCIVVIHKPDRSKGYYGGDVTGPVFKKVADWIYSRTPRKIPETKSLFAIEQKISEKKEFKLNLEEKNIPNTLGYNGSEVISALENLGLDVKYTGIGKVVSQSIPAGRKFKRGETIYLELKG